MYIHLCWTSIYIQNYLLIDDEINITRDKQALIREFELL